MPVKVSLIITVYNRSHLFRKALLSLKNQSVQPDELIISDDGSDEDIVGNTKDIINSFSFPVKYVSQKKQGFRLAKCRNNGVLNSTGDLLIFFDQDIIHTPNFLKVFVENCKPGYFITSYPIRLTENQSNQITEEVVRLNNFKTVSTLQQRNKVRKQFLKDRISTILYNLNIEKNKPKLRGSGHAINREDYFAVNGFDENFNAWGSEDDDIRRRLNKHGVGGINPFCSEYSLHLYHEPFHTNGKRENREYNDKRRQEIAEGDYVCKYGIGNPLDDEELKTITLNRI